MKIQPHKLIIKVGNYLISMASGYTFLGAISLKFAGMAKIQTLNFGVAWIQMPHDSMVYW